MAGIIGVKARRHLHIFLLANIRQGPKQKPVMDEPSKVAQRYSFFYSSDSALVASVLISLDASFVGKSTTYS